MKKLLILAVAVGFFASQASFSATTATTVKVTKPAVAVTAKTPAPTVKADVKNAETAVKTEVKKVETETAPVTTKEKAKKCSCKCPIHKLFCHKK